MSFRSGIVSQPRPGSVRSVQLPRRLPYHPSPADWRDEILYFLLPDRFSDGRESARPLLDRANIPAARPSPWMWNHWAESGGDRWQGGSLAGIQSKLDYVKDLGATTIWLGPCFKQRRHLDTYHGYAIQDFLEVDPRLGDRKALLDLVDAAHAHGLRVILDVVFNHSGCNWNYVGDKRKPPFKPWPDFYQKGAWFDGQGNAVAAVAGNDDGVWPDELQSDDYYTRAGSGNLGAGGIDDPHAEMRRTDFIDLRDFNFDGTQALNDLVKCYKYWIALSDCDGFRLDTLKHVSEEEGRNFCGAIKEFAANLGKADFFLVGEVAGSDADAERYRQVLGRNLNATLDIGPIRRTLHAVAKGLAAPGSYLDAVAAWDPKMGSHRLSGKRHVSILDDHDHVSGDKVRFSSDAASAHQVVAGVAIQLFSLGIPCIYYGTEQAFAGPEKSERDQYLSDYNVGDPPPDKYLREAMFGPEHPRHAGSAGLQPGSAAIDPSLPGFGPFGSTGHHCFDPTFPAYRRIAALAAVRSRFPVLRYGRQYARDVSNFGAAFARPPGGEIMAWSRILDDEEALCVVNTHGIERRGGNVTVDATLNAGPNPFLQVVANSAQAAAAAYAGTHPVGERLPVKHRDGAAYVEIRDVGPSETLVLVNRP